MTSVNGTVAIIALSVAVLGATATGCASHSPSLTAPFPVAATTPSAGGPAGTVPASGSTQPFDYTRLLITARDILAADDDYTAQPPALNPNGTQGAEVLFTNRDQTRAIGDSIVNLPTATAARARSSRPPPR
jgi:hypothetical protein